MPEAVQEALTFHHVHGWSMQDAIALTGACPKLVAKTKRRTGAMETYVPTPSEIARLCNAFRRENSRHQQSYGANSSSAKEKTIREYSVGANST